MKTNPPTPPRSISRRDFLKLGSAAALGLLAFPTLPGKLNFPGKPIAPADSVQYGRVLSAHLDGFDRPSLSATATKSYFRDLVVEITSVTLGDEEPAHNRVWYQVNGESYVHSGSVQPVNIFKNSPLAEIPAGGLLAEVSVPFTDATYSYRQPNWLAYRLYFGSTHWLQTAVQDEAGSVWYRIDDDKWGIRYYVRAEHMRVITAEDIAPISPQVPPEEKSLQINLTNQVVLALEYGVPVFAVRASTGAKFRDGDFRTPTGYYITSRKRPSRHMASGDRAAANGYDLPGVPWVTYLTENGISFHGTFWHNDFGKPRSHGCINLSTPDALWIYRWTLPHVPLAEIGISEETGTSVTIVE